MVTASQNVTQTLSLVLYNCCLAVSCSQTFVEKYSSLEFLYFLQIVMSYVIVFGTH